MWAVDKGQKEIVKLIIGHNGLKPEEKHIKAVKYIFLGRKIFNSEPSVDALIHTIEHEEVTVAKWLLAHEQVNINAIGQEGSTTLIAAVKKTNDTIVKLLVRLSDIDVNVTDEDGYTALIWASDAGNVAIMSELLGHKDILVNKSDSDGHTALTWASDKGRVEAINLLLSILVHIQSGL